MNMLQTLIAASLGKAPKLFKYNRFLKAFKSHIKPSALNTDLGNKGLHAGHPEVIDLVDLNVQLFELLIKISRSS